MSNLNKILNMRITLFCLARAPLSNYKSRIDVTPTREYKTAKT